MAVITNIAPTTELEAINAMLAAIGEAPITDVATATQADVAMAVSELRSATRELQSVPWRFNYEVGVELAPTDSGVWTDSSGAATLLNIFKVPSGIAQWRTTKCRENGDLDLVQRPAKFWIEAGIKPLILYDRTYNRDGADATQYPLIYLDVLFAFDFEQMPETARRYATVVAARRFIQHVVGSDTLAGFTQRDEAIALRNLRRDQGDEEDLNMLNTHTAHAILGYRPRAWGGFTQVVQPGSNPVPTEVRGLDGGVRVID